VTATFIIDYSEFYPGYGKVYQGGGPDVSMSFDKIMVVQMARDIGQLMVKKDQYLVFMGIDDGPSGVLPDEILISMAGLCRSWLSHGNDCVYGCFLGRSRSTYMNTATMMLITGWGVDKCLQKISSMREIAIMPCFVEQLKRLEVLWK